jgi:hypothetical protein
MGPNLSPFPVSDSQKIRAQTIAILIQAIKMDYKDDRYHKARLQLVNERKTFL